MKGFWSTEKLEYFQEQGLESDKWSELRRGGMWSIYKGSEVEWGVGLGVMCEIECYIVWFTHCSEYLVVFSTDSSILGSTRFWV